MISALLGMALTAFLSVVGKLVTESFMEVLMAKLIIFSGEKLAKMTSNTIDDEIVSEIKKRLGADNEKV
jgi:hypothetical protein